jgi:uncharacterized protein
MPVAALEKLLREAAESGFRQAIITGGEPLFHRQRAGMLEMVGRFRRRGRPLTVVLRTNFALPLEPAEMRAVSQAFDQIVVSVDGTEEFHDARRGKGAHSRTAGNLEAFLGETRSLWGEPLPPAELSIASVMPAALVRGPEGQAVRSLADRLGIRRARFRPLLPIGRAGSWQTPPLPEAVGGHMTPMELIESGFQPVSTCGVGQNLYIEPSGDAFPCYACNQTGHSLLNAIRSGLPAVLNSDLFRRLAMHSVDTNRRCRTCDLRYLCGGACKAWETPASRLEWDAPPANCVALKTRADALLKAAMDYLELPTSTTEDPCSIG